MCRYLTWARSHILHWPSPLGLVDAKQGSRTIAEFLGNATAAPSSIVVALAGVVLCRLLHCKITSLGIIVGASFES